MIRSVIVTVVVNLFVVVSMAETVDGMGNFIASSFYVALFVVNVIALVVLVRSRWFGPAIGVVVGVVVVLGALSVWLTMIIGRM